jgi:hypothetical protein
MAKHGTGSRYLNGCRCDECKNAQRLYQRRYRERKENGLTRSPAVVVGELPQAEAYQIDTPGPVERAVKDEIGGLAAEARPGLAQVALAMARLLDNPKAVNQPRRQRCWPRCSKNCTRHQPAVAAVWRWYEL